MRRTDDVSLWPWPLTLEVTAIVGYTRPGTLSEYQVHISVILRLFVFDLWPLGQHSSDQSRDLTTLTFDLEGHGACGWCRLSSSIRVPSLKFVGLATRKIWRTMCVSSINGPVEIDIWPFDLELLCKSHLRWGTFLPHLGTLGLCVLELFAMYATDGRTKAMLPSPRGGSITICTTHKL